MGGKWSERSGGWAARGRLYLPIGLFGVSMSPIIASYRPRQA